jgi:hypothetical protein
VHRASIAATPAREGPIVFAPDLSFNVLGMMTDPC